MVVFILVAQPEKIRISASKVKSEIIVFRVFMESTFLNEE